MKAGQVLHSCRQLVPWGVYLSVETSATLTPCSIAHGELPRHLAGRKGRMTSSQYDPYIWGHTHPTMGRYNGLPSRKAELIPVKTPLSSD